MLINGDKIVTNPTQSPANVFVLKGELTASKKSDVGAILTLQNNFGVDLIIMDMYINVTTVSTAAATLDIGVDDGVNGAVVQLASSDTLFDGLDVNTATGFFCTSKHGGSHGVHSAVWKKGEYVLATAPKSGNPLADTPTTGLVGEYIIRAVAL